MPLMTVAAVALAAAVESSDGRLTADQIMARVVARFEANRIAREGLEYTKEEVVSDLDESMDGPSIKRTGAWRMWITGGIAWQQRIMEDNERVRNAKVEKPGVDMASRLTRFYDYELADEPLRDVFGHPCWVVRFTPNGRVRPTTLEEEITSRLAGTFYVDTQGFWLRRVEGKLIREYTKRVVGIPVGTVHAAFFRLEQQEVLGAIMPLDATLDIRYKQLIVTYRERYEYRYSDYALRP